MVFNLRAVADWAEANGESGDARRALLRIPARLGLLDADLGALSADQASFERDIAGRGCALVSRARNMEGNGRREDTRVRRLLARFYAAQGGVSPRD